MQKYKIFLNWQKTYWYSLSVEKSGGEAGRSRPRWCWGLHVGVEIIFAEGGREMKQESPGRKREGVCCFWLHYHNHFAGGVGADFDDVNACCGYGDRDVLCGSWQGCDCSAVDGIDGNVLIIQAIIMAG